MFNWYIQNSKFSRKDDTFCRKRSFSFFLNRYCVRTARTTVEMILEFQEAMKCKKKLREEKDEKRILVERCKISSWRARHSFKIKTSLYILNSHQLSAQSSDRASNKRFTLQRRLAWSLSKNDTQNRREANLFFSP